MDLVANHSIRSGQIAAYLEMPPDPRRGAEPDRRPRGRMAQALSDQTVEGTATTGGFDLETAGWLNGDRINLTYRRRRHVPHHVTIIRVDDPTALPLTDTATPDRVTR